MSKITIVSRPEQHLLIDISGCTSFREAIEQLSAALLNANQFWQGVVVDLNLGNLLLNKAQLAQIIALTKGVGINAKNVFAENEQTKTALEELMNTLELSMNEKQVQNKEVLSQVSSVSVLSENDSSNVESIVFENKNNETDKSIESTEMETVANLVNQDDKQSDDKKSDLGETEEKPGNRQSLYIKQTMRAGQAVSHKGDLIIIGDVNAGAEVIAEGDITVWGSLRGIAHAGVGGNTKAEIRALRLQPIQLRIAHYIARSPDALPSNPSIMTASPFMAETAKLVNGKIRVLREIFDEK